MHTEHSLAEKLELENRRKESWKRHIYYYIYTSKLNQIPVKTLQLIFNLAHKFMQIYKLKFRVSHRKSFIELLSLALEKPLNLSKRQKKNKCSFLDFDLTI